MSSEKFKSLKNISTKDPVEEIIDQVNGLISTGALRTGDKIPSERFLSDKFNVGRMFVRDALSKLTFYGILKKGPQGGRIVADNKDSALMALATNTLSLVKPNYKSLMEVRLVLEVKSAKLAAARADANDIAALEETVAQLGQKVSNGESGLEEDLKFHIAVAAASKNEMLKYLVTFVVSHMMKFTGKHDLCRDARNLKAYNEHVIILEHIKNGDITRAKNAMKDHVANLFGLVEEE